MLMFEKLKPVKEWVRYEMHDPDATKIEIVARAVRRFQLDESEALALCESLGVQYYHVAKKGDGR